MTSQQPIDVFVQRLATIQALLSQLQSGADNHFDLDPDSITWANAGDLARIEDALRLACAVAFGESE